jgi:hypothetical protein
MVIDLCTPSMNAGMPAKAYSPPRPMRERITPAQKPTLKRPPITALDATASPSKPKKQKVVEKELEKVDPKAAKQRRAAEIIVNREMKSAEEASDLAIFGEVVGEAEEEKMRKLEEEASLLGLNRVRLTDEGQGATNTYVELTTANFRQQLPQ